MSEYVIAAGVWHTSCSLAVSTAARCALFRQRRNARGAICARSFTSELADSLRLIITRQRVSSFELIPLDTRLRLDFIPQQVADYIHAFVVICQVAFLYYELKKKDRFRTVFFLSNPKDWYVISRERVCNRRRRMASRVACIFPSD